MAGVLHTAALWRTGPGMGWASYQANFPEQEVAAHVSLSGYRLSFPERYPSFQPAYAHCWIESPLTPSINVGGFTIPNPDRNVDMQVWLTTSWLLFQLQTDGVGGTAVGFVHSPREAAGLDFGKIIERADRLVFDAEGRILATHREVQLAGGPDLDEGAIDELLLSRVRSALGREEQPGEVPELRVRPVDLDRLPRTAGTRVDPSTGDLVSEDPART